MSFLKAEFSALFQILVFLIHVVNGLFVADDMQIIAPSRAVFSIKPEVMDSFDLKRGQPSS